MSSDETGTRSAILEATERLLVERGVERVRLVDVAERAGVSRQAVYLHFGSRAGLLVALVRHLDEVHGLARLIQTVEEAPDGIAALDAFVESWGRYIPLIHAPAEAMQAACVHDAEADAAWKDRMDVFKDGCQKIVERLAEDRALARGWEVTEAAEFLWAVASIRTWSDLTQDCGWPLDRYIRKMRRALRRVLVDPKRGRDAQDC